MAHLMAQKIREPRIADRYHWKVRQANLKIADETGRKNTRKLIPKKKKQKPSTNTVQGGDAAGTGLPGWPQKSDLRPSQITSS